MTETKHFDFDVVVSSEKRKKEEEEGGKPGDVTTQGTVMFGMLLR